MQLDAQSSTPGRERRLHDARDETSRIQQDIAVAGAELELTNALLGAELPESLKRSGEVRRALAQNGAIEDKVQQAAEELQVVSELRQEEVAERQRLEQELERHPALDTLHSPAA